MNGINTTLDKGGNGSSKAAQLSVAITYSELLALRNSGTLTPGTWYRITDYTCTTTQDETQSAGHVFDIIVRADDASHLNENAYAAHHEGDTYFQDCKLEAWELKYCIDNDNTRFAWADEDGKGVIFFMKDEWNNQCPYDFKNIMFKRWAVTDESEGGVLSDLDSKYVGFNAEMRDLSIQDEEDFIFAYTFTYVDGDGNNTDASINPFAWKSLEDYTCKSGVMGNLISPSFSKVNTDEESFDSQYLNNIVFFEQFNVTYKCCSGNIIGNECVNMTFLSGCFDNQIKGDARSLVFGEGCYGNTFEVSTGTCSFGRSFYYNVMLHFFMDNTFGNSCGGNTFGNSCSDNTFGNDCQSNTFGNNCQLNTFGNDCGYNTFGNSCGGNTFGNYFWSNTFGNDCQRNTFGNYCKFNTFGNSCYSNTFGNNIQYITVFENVRYCNVTGGTSGSYVQNAQILNGTQGTDVNKLTINFATGKNYTQVAGKNTSGTLKIFNPADNA